MEEGAAEEAVPILSQDTRDSVIPTAPEALDQQTMQITYLASCTDKTFTANCSRGGEVCIWPILPSLSNPTSQFVSESLFHKVDILSFYSINLTNY